MFVFAVYDKVAEVYGTPFFARSKQEGVRCFVDVACDNRSVIYRHPSDYVLRLVGCFEDRTGRLDGLDSPEQLLDGVEALRRGSAVGGETPFKTQSDQPAVYDAGLGSDADVSFESSALSKA